ncbi:MAG TPA: DNA repair protein RecN [Bacteroidales bacterium]|nr:DNA repair protein RecN [Bacteroidales bacterium]
MLVHLLVENYALIEKLDITFTDGLTVITGETGAGKSIMLGALGLILGQRADTQALLQLDKKCIVEGTFNLTHIAIQDLFDNHHLDYEPLSCFRREITPQGKSRAFVNDTPVNLTVLKELADRLIDIHSQHQTLLLGNSSFQFDVLDSFAGNLQLLQEYKALFQTWLSQKSQLESLVAAELKSKSDIDYYKFLYDELQKSQLSASEFVQLEKDLKIMSNAEAIKMGIDKAVFLFSGSEVNVIDALNESHSAIKPIAKFNDRFQALSERIESAIIEIKDLHSELLAESESVTLDPEQASILQQRFDHLVRLMAKHNAKAIEDLIITRDNFLEKISAVETLEESIANLNKELKHTENQLYAKAQEVSQSRKEAIPQFEQEITAMCRKLAMTGARFVVQCTQMPEPSLNGMDKISFLFNANVGGELGEIAKVASGGELSRLMLSIKSTISQRNLLPTIIFDEIDAGISGETAHQVGKILESIAHNMQVMAITHLPQIASRGKSHLVVQKIVEGGKTRTEINEIGQQQRIVEIAKMLGGQNPSETMLETARELFFKSSNN